MVTDTGGAQAAVPPGLERTTYRTIALRLMPILFLAYVFNFLDRSNIAFAKLQMQSDLALSDTVYGLGAGIFFIGYFLFEVPSNLALHRFGARRWLARIMASWGLISALMCLTQGPLSFYALRFLLGVAEAGLVPGVLFYLNGWFPAARRARMIAVFYTAVPVSGVLGGPVAGLILGALNSGRLAPWQWLFIVEGIPTVVLAVVLLFLLPDRPADASWLSPAQRELVRRQLEAGAAAHADRAAILDALRDRRVWLLIVSFFGQCAGIIGYSLWLPTLVQSSGVKDVVAIGFLTAIPYLVAIPALLLNGAHSDRTGERRWHVAAPMMAAAAGLVVCVSAGPNPAFALLGLTLVASGILAAAPAFWPIPASFLRGRNAATGLALINALGNLGSFGGPFFIGYARDLTGSTTPGLLALAAGLVVGGLAVLAVESRHPALAMAR